MRRLLAVLVALLLIAGGIAVGYHLRHATSSSTTSTSTTSTPSTSTTTSTSMPSTSTTLASGACNGPALTLTTSLGSGAAGTIEFPIVFTNTSSLPCTLGGWPTLRYLGANAQPLALTSLLASTGFSVSGANHPPTLVVTLGVGAQARVELKYSDVPTGTAQSCPSVTSVLVTVPGSSPVELPVTMTPCGGVVTVSPFYAP